MSGCQCKPCCKCIKCRCGSYASIFEVLGHPTRLQVIMALQNGPKNVSQVIRETGMRQTGVSHCLRKLEEEGFVTAERDGKYRIYRLNASAIGPMNKFLKKHVSESPRAKPGTTRS